MTAKEARANMTDLITQFVNAIAQKEYGTLASFAKTESWCQPGESQEEGFLSFGEWLEEQLAGWEEDEGRPFAIDPFQAASLDLDEDGFLPSNNGKHAFATYQLTNAGEPLDLWFEFRGMENEDGTLSILFDVNL